MANYRATSPLNVMKFVSGKNACVSSRVHTHTLSMSRSRATSRSSAHCVLTPRSARWAGRSWGIGYAARLAGTNGRASLTTGCAKTAAIARRQCG